MYLKDRLESILGALSLSQLEELLKELFIYQERGYIHQGDCPQLHNMVGDILFNQSCHSPESALWEINNIAFIIYAKRKLLCT